MINNIKKERVKIGISQDKLAKKVGVSRPTISNIERGIYDPSGPLLLAIAQVIGKPAEQIFFIHPVKHALQGSDN
ncbi:MULTISPECIES: helix-turn-helix transcriptional regulator [unclassified Clostridium]|uniref:helix-turn-helix transcriptional regulator n=1 Tax=unclassified Clostridium TaxID=2614128 RepID=UPI000297484F|nr:MULTISPECIES: helix-turn-helix transcriptional regulator [unclassified Clostridium]EKQ52407.1 MAG: putative transcriptional regulator [Clostridium sp. Maddingley MBC34-26]